MATTKAKTKPRAKKTSSRAVKTATKKPVAAKVIAPVEKAKKQTIVAKIFGRKYDNKNENILTIFKNPKIIGALIAELVGSMLVVAVLLAVGTFNALFDSLMVSVVMLGASLVLFAVSGANINPIITIGLAPRRISIIRGVLYIIAQILGAWCALLIVSAFMGFNPDLSVTLPAMTELTFASEGVVGTFWALTILELIGAAILGFFFARAVAHKRSAFTFAAIVAGGTYIVFTLGMYVTAGFLGIQEHSYIFNPAAAIMYQILPTAGADFGEIMSKIGIALSTYVLAPAVGSVIGFYLSDTAAALADTDEK